MIDEAEVREILERVAFDAKGLIPAIIQEEGTKDVLMLGYMDGEALRRTLTSGRVTFWSRSRGEYWRKGDTSGRQQKELVDVNDGAGCNQPDQDDDNQGAPEEITHAFRQQDTHRGTPDVTRQRNG